MDDPSFAQGGTNQQTRRIAITLDFLRSNDHDIDSRFAGQMSINRLRNTAIVEPAFPVMTCTTNHSPFISTRIPRRHPRPGPPAPEDCKVRDYEQLCRSAGSRQILIVPNHDTDSGQSSRAFV